MTCAKKFFGNVPASIVRCCLLLTVLCLAACAARSEGEGEGADGPQVKVSGQYDVSIGTVR